MSKFAIVENGIVINTILADSKTIAEQVTGKTAIEFTDEPAEVGGTYVNNTFFRKKPFPSWIKDGDSWKAPVDLPTSNPDEPQTGYDWDESTLSWISDGVVLTPPVTTGE